MEPQSIPEVINGQNGKSAPGSTDSFVDSALEAFGDLAGEVPAGDAPTQPRAKKERPGAEDGDREEEEGLPGAGDDEADQSDDEDAGDEGEAHDTRGSLENPLTAKDLPDHLHVEVKVDGKKETIKLKDAIDGYIGQKTISQRLNKTKQLTDEAEAHIARAKQTEANVKDALRQFLSDPDQIREYFLATEEREAVFRAAAQYYAAQVKRFRENPHEELAFKRQRDVARIEAERAHFENQRREELAQKQRKENEARMMAIWNPGWNDGIKRAGFPQMDQGQQQALFQEVALRCEQRVRSGHEITSDDVSEFVVRAAKLLELPKKGERRPKPAPLPSTKERAQRRGNDPWAGKSQRQKLASPDWFLRNLKPRDFR